MKAFVSEQGLRRCAGCGGSFRPPGAGAGCCSDRCYVRSRRQEPQAARIGRAITRMQDRAQQRVVARVRVERLLGDAALNSDVKRYRRERADTMALIGRLQQAAVPFAAKARASYGAIARNVSGDLPAECTGPDCPVCTEARRLEASRGDYEITRAVNGDLCRNCGYRFCDCNIIGRGAA